MRIGFLPHMLLFLFVLLSKEGLTEIVDKRGRVEGASFVNLRSGPGLTHPPVAILRSGEQVSVEGSDGSWFRVSLRDGRRGYIYKDLVHLLSRQGTEVPEQETEVPMDKEMVAERRPEVPNDEEAFAREETEISNEAPVAKPAGADKEVPTGSLEVLPSQAEVATSQQVKRPMPNPNAVLSSEMDPGERWTTSKWLVIGLCIFILGWICGGNYYLRRDRIERTRLRL
ncbi:MAG: SH3 domain-containing protein [Candidatus Binatia bacterium]